MLNTSGIDHSGWDFKWLIALRSNISPFLAACNEWRAVWEVE